MELFNPRTIICKSAKVNFIFILFEAFTWADLKNTKIQSSQQSYCAFGICKCKSRHKMLVKSTPGVNFTNKFTLNFYACSSQKLKNSAKFLLSFYNFGIYECKSACKMLMKLTPGAAAITVVKSFKTYVLNFSFHFKNLHHILHFNTTFPQIGVLNI